MVVDFGDIKKIVNEEIIELWDHAVLLNGESPHQDLGKDLEQKGHKVIFCNYQPTCENMLYDIAAKIQNKLPEGVSLAYLKMHETENSYGEWFAEEQ
jgi:6-pyruvoyltetrahydropterin/6-carboxytetrahydropterin synthase